MDIAFSPPLPHDAVHDYQRFVNRDPFTPTANPLVLRSLSFGPSPLEGELSAWNGRRNRQQAMAVEMLVASNPDRADPLRYELAHYTVPGQGEPGRIAADETIVALVPIGQTPDVSDLDGHPRVRCWWDGSVYRCDYAGAAE